MVGSYSFHALLGYWFIFMCLILLNALCLLEQTSNVEFTKTKHTNFLTSIICVNQRHMCEQLRHPWICIPDYNLKSQIRPMKPIAKRAWELEHSYVSMTIVLVVVLISRWNCRYNESNNKAWHDSDLPFLGKTSISWF